MGIKLLIIGAGGRMGGRIVCLAVESGRFDVVGAVDRSGHPGIGKDAGVAAGSGQTGIMLTDTYPGVAAQVAIDFSQPEATDATLDYCLKKNVALVLGTTGLNEKQRETLKSAARKIPILYTTNMSVGMNTLFGLVGKVAEMLGPEYDVEIVEQHHRSRRTHPAEVH